MPGNFEVWWDPKMPGLRWSGRGELDANPIGPRSPGATRNHIVSHSMAMRMLINRINEAYLQQNHFSLKQNIDLILAGTCIMIVNLPANCDVMIARNAILKNVGPTGSVEEVCEAIRVLEYYILNSPCNMRYGFHDVNSQIGDCLDLPANQILVKKLPKDTMVRLGYNATAVPLNDWACVRYPTPMSQSDLAIRCLLHGTDWKDWEIQIMGGKASYWGTSDFFIASSTDSRHFNLHHFSSPDDPDHYHGFGIQLANSATHSPEWFLFQQTSELTYTAMRETMQGG